MINTVINEYHFYLKRAQIMAKESSGDDPIMSTAIVSSSPSAINPEASDSPAVVSDLAVIVSESGSTNSPIVHDEGNRFIILFILILDILR